MAVRIIFFDIIKGLAMFFVVNWHIMNDIGISEKVDLPRGCFIYYVLNLIQLPLFMFASGFFAYRQKNLNNSYNSIIRYIRPNLIKRSKQLLLPIIFGSLCWSVYIQFVSDRNLYEILTEIWPGNPFYFLWCVFFLYVIYYIICPLLRRLNSIYASCGVYFLLYLILIILNKFIPSKISDCLYLNPIVISFYIPFVFGLLCGRYKKLFLKYLKDSRLYSILLLIFIISSYILILGSINWISGLGFILVEIQIISLIIVTTMLAYHWSQKINISVSGFGNYIYKFFIWLGQNSLMIYILHFFFRFNLSSLIPWLSETNFSSIALLLVTIPLSLIIIFCCSITRHIISKSPTLNLLILGGNK